MKKINYQWLYIYLLSIVFLLCGCSNSVQTPPVVTQEVESSTVTSSPEVIVEEHDSPTPTSYTDTKHQYENTNIEMHFIDVGQADAALLISDGHYMLIDGGNAQDSSLIYSYLNKLNINYLDYMIGTHAHEDHMGGLSGALQKADVGTVFAPRTENDAKFYQSFKKKLTSKGLSVTNPTSGTTFEFGSCSVQLLCPKYENASDLNNTSIITKVKCGNTAFLFTGDAERDEEQDILNQGYDLSANVLKAGHHGSEYSSSYPFLREIMPEYIVISVGKDNSYGHPHSEALSRFRDVGARVYRTDLQGDVIFKSDGNSISLSTEKNENANTNPLIEEGSSNSQAVQSVNNEQQYIGNKKSKKFHRPSCHSLPAEHNRVLFDTREEAICNNYQPCKNCNP